MVGTVGCGIGGDGKGLVIVGGRGASGLKTGSLHSMTGVYLRRNLRFLRVALPDPSTLTIYWLYCLTSMITPDLSHFFG